MSDKNSNDVFDLLNSEFASFELEKENARNLEALRRRQAIRQQIAYQQQNDEQDDDDEEEDEGTGCVGVTFRILLIIILAGALAWIVFMPEGSLKELWDKYSPKVSSTFSWVSGLISGEKKSGDRVNPEIITTSDIKNSENDDVSDIAEDAAYAGTDTEQSDDGSAQDIAASDSPYNITVYRPSQIVVVYDSSGNPVKVFSCSSGKAATPTKLGDYSIRAKYRWRFMVGNCYTQYASSFSNGYLFHSIPYNKKNAGTMSNSSYDKLGNPASSGCVRLCFRDTKWIFDNCPIGTPVHVSDENAPAGSVPEIIPERVKDSAHSGWDPTDDSPENPYNK